MNYLDQLPDGILILDEDSRIVLANKTFLAFFGLAAEQVIGKTCREFYLQCAEPHGVPDFICPHRAIMETGEPIRVAHTYRGRNGKDDVLVLLGLPIKDEQGRAVRVMEILRDISGKERTRAEILREVYAHDIIGSLSEEYLRDGGLDTGLSLTVEKIRAFYKPDFVEILLPDKDRKELVLKSGHGWDGTFRVPAEETSIEGQVYLQNKSVRTADIRQLGSAAGAHLTRHGVRGGLWLPIPSEDSSITIGVCGICFKDSVEIPAAETWVLGAILKDLSVYLRKEIILDELRESKDFVSSILDGIGDGVVVIDRDFKIISANQGYLNQCHRSAAEVLGRHCYEVSHRIDKPCYLAGEACSVKEAFETGVSRRIVHTHFDKRGKPIYIETISYPLTNSAGEIVSAIEVLTNVSERVALEKEVRQRMKELEDFYAIAIDRELKMKELKDEIARLKHEGP
ncbi:MAG TPA: PAS domain-containing protein [Candidatus Methanoperedens sp.]|nr:PAS domain-containing protein [Candidatus Methanoperedens sp.]